MNYYSDFVVSFGLMLVLIGAAASWLFRTSRAHLAFKLALPAALIALACHTPIAVNGLLGLPVDTTLDALPKQAQLLAFVPLDNDKRVDLWLLAGDVPRAYQAPLNPDMRQMLKSAQSDMKDGRRVYIRKKADKNAKPGQNGSVAEWTRREPIGFEIVDGAALLPAKE